MPAGDPRERRELVLLTLGVTICGVWVIAMLVQVALPSHKVPTEAHGIVALLIPLLFGSAFLTGRKNGNGGDK